MAHNRAYTLIEVMVAVGIFFTLVAAPAGFFVSSLQAQQKTLASQELVDGISYALEHMSRSLRMAKKDLDNSCDIGENMNYGVTREGKGIKFKNYQGICQEFFWDASDNRLKEIKEGGGVVPLTAEKLEVLSFKIGSSDSWDQGDQDQPRVTLSLMVKNKRSVKLELQPTIKIQTTISQRNLDVQY